MKTGMNLKRTNIILRRSIKLINIRKPMKKLILFSIPIILLSCNSEQKKNNLENSVWKFSDGPGHISDVMVFNKEHLYTKNDSIFMHKSDTLIGVIDTITLHYGERRLYVKNLSGNIGRYSEQ